MTTQSFTVQDVVAAYLAAEASEDSLRDALAADSAAVTTAYLLTADVLAAGTSARSIATAARAAGSRGWGSAASVINAGRAGEVLALGGDMPTDADDNPISPRALALVYNCSKLVDGRKVNTSVTAAQHKEILAVADDTADAYLRLLRQNAANLRDATAATDDTAADDDDDTAADDTAATRSVTERLSAALRELESVDAVDAVDDVSILAAIAARVAALTAIPAMVPEFVNV